MPLISSHPIWYALQKRARALPALSEMFETDPGRGDYLSVDLGDLFADFSRQRIDRATFDDLLALAEATDVAGYVSDMADGEIINDTEGRAVLHTACRGTPAKDPEIAKAVADADAMLETFVSGIHDGSIATASGGKFKSVVAIGIGGSELGPALALDALSDICPAKLDVRMCGNIDGVALERAFQGLDPATTLVVVISKSFTTLETATNAERAKTIMQSALGEAWPSHFAVVSANLKATGSFGVADERVFPMWDWVGGRYSVWSAVGLPVALAFGWNVFQAFRDGAKQMDTHALSAPLAENLPVLMGLITVWNTSFIGYAAEACVPYDTRLSLLVAHLQQLEMESNGKRVTRDGETISYNTQPVVFGGVGTNVQHAFFQQLHQGTVEAPVDFLISATPPAGDAEQNRALTANALAQADALAFGKSNAAEPHRHYPGNRPSSILIYDALSPAMLGKLIALYEHKTAVAGRVWGINPFDQWGVELGKVVSGDILPMLSGETEASTSLQNALAALKRMGSQR
jgi:glucose-6-phosphate isomerase